MRVVARASLRTFWTRHPDARAPLTAWLFEVERADWQGPAEVKANYRSASILDRNRVVFNIGGNKYRLIAAINYGVGVVFIKFIGTHAEYDKIDARTVEWKPRF
jgi:mRNA interferase HigB